MDRAALIRNHSENDQITALAFDYTGRMLVTGNENGIVRIFSIETVGNAEYQSQLLQEYHWFTNPVTSITFSDGCIGNFIAASSSTGTLLIAEGNYQSWTEIYRNDLPEGCITKCRFGAPNLGLLIACGTLDGKLHFIGKLSNSNVDWRNADWFHHRIPNIHPGGVTSLSFCNHSEDHFLLVSTGIDGCSKISQANDSDNFVATIATLPIPTNGPLDDCEFRPKFSAKDVFEVAAINSTGTCYILQSTDRYSWHLCQQIHPPYFTQFSDYRLSYDTTGMMLFITARKINVKSEGITFQYIVDVKDEWQVLDESILQRNETLKSENDLTSTWDANNDFNLLEQRM